MSLPPRRSASWRVPRSAPVPPPAPRWRAALRGVLLGGGTALVVYLGWSRWQDSPRQAARTLRRDDGALQRRAPEPARDEARARSVQTDEVATLLDEAAARGASDAPLGEGDVEGLVIDLAPFDAGTLAGPPPAPLATAAPAPGPRVALLPAGHPAGPTRASESSAPEAPLDDEPSAHASERRAPIERHVQLVTFNRWQHPGLCPTDNEAAHARQLMMRRFRAVAWDTEARLYLDPRLARGAHEELIEQLTAAETEVETQLGLSPARPNVFAYYDSRLLLAGSCANADVVAYYDGAVHVVPSHDDVAQSVVHEYTHHALASAGVSGPAWAHEGIAMHVARETWWRQREWLERVADRPFSLEDMESAVPYTLVSEQAVAFYVQAAAMVACTIHEDPAGLKKLVQDLADGSRGGELEYKLAPLADPRGFHACTRELLG